MKFLTFTAFVLTALLTASCQDGGGGDPDPECGLNEELVNGVCECVEGHEPDETGVCVVIPPPPPLECGANEKDVDGACVCVNGYIRDPKGACGRPQLYIQWDRRETEWAKKVDLAYSVHRGDRDLQKILDFGRCYLEGGSKELVPMTSDELTVVIAKMRAVDFEGNRIIHRIKTQPHRFFDAGEPWLRSQVRKTRANEMKADLEDQTDIYGGIASRFPQVAGCDAVGCKIKKFPC